MRRALNTRQLLESLCAGNAEAIYIEGMTSVDISVDLIFEVQGPKFGDLFTICGYENPSFPPEGDFDFHQFRALQFSQVDDYFGVRTTSDAGDVEVWLFPLINGEVVDHNPGPFDGLRICYDVLRNPIERSQHFISVVEKLSQELDVRVQRNSAMYDLRHLREDIQKIADAWARQGIEVGSAAATELEV